MSSISENLKNNIAKQTQSIHEALVIKHECVRMPEDIFVNVFLPYFINAESLENDPSIIAKWISIAGSPMSEVDVVDNDSIVVFRVPSLFDSTGINVIDRRVGESIADISAEFDLKNNNIPSVAQNFLTHKLHNKLSIFNPSINPESKTKWDIILKRYNISNPEIQAISDNEIIDDIEYD